MGAQAGVFNFEVIEDGVFVEVDGVLSSTMAAACVVFVIGADDSAGVEWNFVAGA